MPRHRGEDQSLNAHGNASRAQQKAHQRATRLPSASGLRKQPGVPFSSNEKTASGSLFCKTEATPCFPRNDTPVSDAAEDTFLPFLLKRTGSRSTSLKLEADAFSAGEEPRLLSLSLPSLASTSRPISPRVPNDAPARNTKARRLQGDDGPDKHRQKRRYRST